MCKMNPVVLISNSERSDGCLDYCRDPVGGQFIGTWKADGLPKPEGIPGYTITAN